MRSSSCNRRVGTGGWYPGTNQMVILFGVCTTKLEFVSFRYPKRETAWAHWRSRVLLDGPTPTTAHPARRFHCALELKRVLFSIPKFLQPIRQHKFTYEDDCTTPASGTSSGKKSGIAAATLMGETATSFHNPMPSLHPRFRGLKIEWIPGSPTRITLGRVVILVSRYNCTIVIVAICTKILPWSS